MTHHDIIADVAALHRELDFVNYQINFIVDRDNRPCREPELVEFNARAKRIEAELAELGSPVSIF